MPTSLEYIHALAAETTEFGEFVTDGAGDVDELVCSTFANNRFSSTEFANSWALIEEGASLGQVASLKTLTRSTGALTFYNELTDAIISGISFSVYKLLPPAPDGSGIPPFLEILNQTLPRVWVERIITFTGVTGQQYYPIDTAAHPWFTDDSRIMWIQAPTSSAQEWPKRLPASAWEWDADGETKRLYFYSAPANTGETFTVKVYAPGNSRLKKNGTWTDQTTQTAKMALYTSGVADEALPAVEDVKTIGKAVMYELLSKLDQPGADVAEWLTKHGPALQAARSRQAFGIPKDRTTGVISLRPTRLARER